MSLKLIKNKYIIILILSLLAILYFLITYSNVSSANINLNTIDNSILEDGKKIYANNCASCHGINLEGQQNWMSRLPNGLMPAPPHDKTGHTWHHPDRYLFMVTKYGIEELIGEKYLNNMPAYKDILSDKEIISVLSYIKSTWPTTIKRIHDQINSRANQN